MKIFTALSIVAAVSFQSLFISCTSTTDKNSAKETNSAKPGAVLSCTGSSVEIPSGEVIYDYVDNGYQYLVSFKIAPDSLYTFSYVKDSAAKDHYLHVDVTAAALKDIDSSKVEPSEYDLGMVDGSKKHETVFFIKSYNEELKFKNRTYTCFSGDNHFETFDIHTVNIPTYSIDVSKKMVEMIKNRLKK